MRKFLFITMALALVVFSVASASAANIALYEYSFKSPSAFNVSAFDFNTGLGSITTTIAGAQKGVYVGAYFDHEIDEATNTYFNEYGAKANGGILPAIGQTWQIDEPGFVNGTIFANFNNQQLDGKVFQDASLQFGGPDDVAMALAWGLFDLAAGETATITFTVGLTKPTTGFWLKQMDRDSNAGFFLSSTFEKTAVPLPAAVWFLGSGLIGLIGLRWRKRA